MMRWTLDKALAAFENVAPANLTREEVERWRLAIPAGRRFETAQALKQALRWLDKRPHRASPRSRGSRRVSLSHASSARHGILVDNLGAIGSPQGQRRRHSGHGVHTSFSFEVKVMLSRPVSVTSVTRSTSTGLKRRRWRLAIPPSSRSNRAPATRTSPASASP
jgi:hypothetical protein